MTQQPLSLICSHCSRRVTERRRGALLGKTCLACQQGKLLEPEPISRSQSPSDHPDPFTSCKPPWRTRFRASDRDIYGPKNRD